MEINSVLNNGEQEKEEVCIHIIRESDLSGGVSEDEENEELQFAAAPFRHTFFRYNINGESEVVKSSNFIYASHHKSPTAWLDIRKLSVALVGSARIPNLALYGPTVKEIYFMGHIIFPQTAFKILPQLSCLKTVIFNLGYGGYINEFVETPDEFVTPTPEILSVTELEIKINHNLYRACTERLRSTLRRMIVSVIKHSNDSFRNLKNLTIDLPNEPCYFDRISPLIERGSLQEQLKVNVRGDKIEVSTRSSPNSNQASLPFDPCARLPTHTEYNDLERIGAHINNFRI